MPRVDRIGDCPRSAATCRAILDDTVRGFAIAALVATSIAIASTAAAQTSECGADCSEHDRGSSRTTVPPATPSDEAHESSDPMRGTELIVPGVVLAVLSFVTNAFTAFGTFAAHIDGGWSPGVDVGVYIGTAFIPIGGPFVSAGLVGERMPASLIAHLVAGVVGLTGWALCIAGTVIWSGQPPPERDAFFAVDWTLTPWISRDAAGAALAVTWK